MTVMFVFAALIVANVVYAVYDHRRMQTAQQMEDFYRVEFKKTYNVDKEHNALSWY